VVLGVVECFVGDLLESGGSAARDFGDDLLQDRDGGDAAVVVLARCEDAHCFGPEGGRGRVGVVERCVGALGASAGRVGVEGGVAVGVAVGGLVRNGGAVGCGVRAEEAAGRRVVVAGAEVVEAACRVEVLPGEL